MTTWEIIPDGIPNLLKDDWHLGYEDYFSNQPLRYPQNQQYLEGWYYAWGTLDGYQEEVMAEPKDPNYRDGYRRGNKLIR